MPLIASLAEYGITNRRVTGHSYEKGHLDCFNELVGLAYCAWHHSQTGNPKLYKKEKNELGSIYSSLLPVPDYGRDVVSSLMFLCCDFLPETVSQNNLSP